MTAIHSVTVEDAADHAGGSFRTLDSAGRPAPPRILVIGYGNELRRDDGVGPRMGALIDAERREGVEVMNVHQLTPELAEPMSHSDAVVFIDACIDGTASVQVRSLSTRRQPCVRAHFADPSVLLALCSELYGRAPMAWCIRVPAEDLGYGEGLSQAAEAMVQPALRAFEVLASSVRMTDSGQIR